MRPTFALTPTSTGKVYCSTFQNFIEKNCHPTTPLPHNHPFWSLWRDHLSSFRSENANDLIDALIAIELCNPNWKDRASTSARTRTARRAYMRDLLSQNPPDVVLLNDLPDYGLHHRWQQTWQFICLNENIINLWAEAREVEVEQRFALAAVVRAMIDHELGHWVQTLVSTCLEFHHVELSYIRNPDLFPTTTYRKVLVPH